MGKRIVVGLTGLAILLPAILFGGALAVEIIVLLAILFGIDEYANMAFGQGEISRRWWAVGLLTPPTLAFYGAVLYGPPGTVGPVLVGSALWFMLAMLFRRGAVDDAGPALGKLILGFAYVPGLFVFLPLIRRFEDGLAWVFVMLAITWLGDTGAYFAGRAFGKHKLYEKISPKKTWEGAIGGAVLATVGVFVTRWICAHWDLAPTVADLGVVECLVLGVLVDAFGVVGDLVESMLKRSFAVKDSGWILPGHGGILDRTDALLFTGPVLWIIGTWIVGL